MGYLGNKTKKGELFYSISTDILLFLSSLTRKENISNISMWRIRFRIYVIFSTLGNFSEKEIKKISDIVE